MKQQNHASSLIIEDQLQKVLGKTKNTAFKTSNNKYVPKNQHSAFGDFPKDYMPKNSTAVKPLEPLGANELSVAAKATGMYIVTADIQTCFLVY